MQLTCGIAAHGRVACQGEFVDTCITSAQLKFSSPTRIVAAVAGAILNLAVIIAFHMRTSDDRLIVH